MSTLSLDGGSVAMLSDAASDGPRAIRSASVGGSLPMTIKRNNFNITPLNLEQSTSWTPPKSPHTVQGVETLTSILRSTTLNDALAHLSTTQRSVATPSSKGVGDYIYQKDLGEGTTGKVRLAMHAATRQLYAIKCVEKCAITGLASAERLLREILFVKLLDHPNIARLYEVIDTPNQIFMVLEYASGGELFDYIVTHQRVKEREARRFFRQIISALQYCHSNMVIHRDLKPENLLLDENLNIKIIDFGFANVTKPGRLLETFCGSPAYAAPEMIAGQKYAGAEVDIWSIGVILYALICGYLPFDDENNARLFKLILEAEYSFPDFVSEGAKDLISRLLRIDPKDRLTLEQVRQHSWVNEGYPALVPFFQSTVTSEGALEEDLVQDMLAFGYSKSDIQAALAAPEKHPHAVAALRLLKEHKERSAPAKAAQADQQLGAAGDDAQAALLGLVASTSSSSIASTMSGSSGDFEPTEQGEPSSSADAKTPVHSFPSPRSVGSQIANAAAAAAAAAAARRGGRRSKRGSDAGFQYAMMTVEQQNRLNTISELEMSDFDAAGGRDMPPDVLQYLKARGRRHSEQPSLAGHNFPLLHSNNSRRRRGNTHSPYGFPLAGDAAKAPSSPLPTQGSPLQFSSTTLAQAPAPYAPLGSPSSDAWATFTRGADASAEQAQQSSFPSQPQTAPVTPSGPLSGLHAPAAQNVALQAQQMPLQQQQQMLNVLYQRLQQEQQQQMHTQVQQRQQTLAQQQQAWAGSGDSLFGSSASASSSTSSLPPPAVVLGSHTDDSQYNGARSVRGHFNVETTSTKHPVAVVQEIVRVLAMLNFTYICTSAFVFQVEATEGGDTVRFELEVGVIARVNLSGIRIKRLMGSTWACKAVCTTILSNLQL